MIVGAAQDPINVKLREEESSMVERELSTENTAPEEELHWKTAISKVRSGKILIRGTI